MLQGNADQIAMIADIAENFSHAVCFYLAASLEDGEKLIENFVDASCGSATVDHLGSRLRRTADVAVRLLTDTGGAVKTCGHSRLNLHQRCGLYGAMREFVYGLCIYLASDADQCNALALEAETAVGIDAHGAVVPGTKIVGQMLLKSARHARRVLGQ
jgi:hypothetical protein